MHIAVPVETQKADTTPTFLHFYMQQFLSKRKEKKILIAIAGEYINKKIIPH